MINEESLQAVKRARINSSHVKPLYDSYCFSRIPGTIYNLLTGGSDPGLPEKILAGLPTHYQKVVLLFIDAFGWRFLESRADEYPFLKRFFSKGVVSKMTAQFPSTTAVHYTTIQSGQTVGAHGVFEMTYYEPLVDRLISPLSFAYIGEPRDSLLQSGITPTDFCSKVTLHQRLREHGVKSYLFQDHDTYSDIMANGAHKIIPHRSFSEGLVNLSEAVLQESGTAYFFLYFGTIDLLGHIYGPSSPQFNAEIDTCLTTLERLLHQALEGKARDTLVLVTADHGQTEISPDETLYINQRVPALLPLIKTNRRGDKLVPAGSLRDMFLYIRPECVDEAHALLIEACEGRADVRFVRDLVAEGYFGSGGVSDTFLSRAADLVILPHDHESVWWFDEDVTHLKSYGYHGGLSANEMETPLLALAY